MQAFYTVGQRKMSTTLENCFYNPGNAKSWCKLIYPNSRSTHYKWSTKSQNTSGSSKRISSQTPWTKNSTFKMIRMKANCKIKRSKISLIHIERPQLTSRTQLISTQFTAHWSPKILTMSSKLTPNNSKKNGKTTKSGTFLS